MMLEDEEERLGRQLDDFEREQRLREIIDMKIEKVVLNLGVSRSSVHFIENYKTGQGQQADRADAFNSLTINYRALRLLHESI